MGTCRRTIRRGRDAVMAPPAARRRPVHVLARPRRGPRCCNRVHWTHAESQLGRNSPGCKRRLHHHRRHVRRPLGRRDAITVEGVPRHAKGPGTWPAGRNSRSSHAQAPWWMCSWRPVASSTCRATCGGSKLPRHDDPPWPNRWSQRAVSHRSMNPGRAVVLVRSPSSPATEI
jgi:hypothetical protein